LFLGNVMSLLQFLARKDQGIENGSVNLVIAGIIGWKLNVEVLMYRRYNIYVLASV
jgi:hypothetical protein